MGYFMVDSHITNVTKNIDKYYDGSSNKSEYTKATDNYLDCTDSYCLNSNPYCRLC